MATLTQITQTTRTFLKWTAIAFLAFLIIRLILIPIGTTLFHTFFPKKPPPPTTSFGKLPQIPFPKTSHPSLTFTIKTTTGSLPTNLPDRLTVYQVEKRQATFSSYDQTKKRVSGIGFTQEGVALSPTIYLWQDPNGEDRTIIANIISDEFAFTTKLATSASQLTDLPPEPSDAVQTAKAFLSSLSLPTRDIDDTKTKTTFLKIANGELEKTTSLSESGYIQIDFYRKSFADLPIVSLSPSNSLISFLLKGSRERSQQIVQATYSYKPVDLTTYSTYPIKTGSEALLELQKGGGYIAQPINSQAPIQIQKVYLAYYEGNDTLAFFLPVFVFEGEGFFALVDAIANQWRQ